MARKPEHNVICIRCRESIASIAHVACMSDEEQEERSLAVARRLAKLTGTEGAR